MGSELGTGLEVAIEVRLLRALEVFSRAIAARDRRPRRDAEAEDGEEEDDDDDWRSGDAALSLGFDGQELWYEDGCDGDWRWC